MGVARHSRTLIALAIAALACACGDRPGAKKSDVTAADVIAGSARSFDHYESSEGKFAIDFPPEWLGNYIASAHADTTAGSHFLVDFRFKPDPGWKVEPRTLLVIRTFTPKAWAKVAANANQTVGVKLKERGNDVFVLSLAAANPYAAGSPAAAMFDKMMLSVVNDPVPLRLTPH
jgi:hypothetical protein